MKDGTSDAEIQFRIADAGEPGKNADTVVFIVTADDGRTWELRGALTGGNNQAHPVEMSQSVQPTKQHRGRPVRP